MNILNERLVCELSFGSCRVCLIVSIKHQASRVMNTILFAKFWTTSKYLNSIKPHTLLVTDDFNVKSSSWWSDDIAKIEGMWLESIASYYDLFQIINEPAHILPSLASCSDLIFTNQPNLAINSGMNPLLHRNYHH